MTEEKGQPMLTKKFWGIIMLYVLTLAIPIAALLSQGGVGAVHQPLWFAALAALGVLLVAGPLGMYWILRNVRGALGGEPAHVHAQMQQLANGNLTTPTGLDALPAHSVLAVMHDMRQAFTRLFGTMRSHAEGVAAATHHITEDNSALTARAQQASSLLQEASGSMDGLISNIRVTVHNAREANTLALTASAVAIQGGEVMAQINQTMDSINEASKRIVDIIGVIDVIAFKTNLLALNAAVEAARAGEQGKGFAVVAAEVRGLAQSSASAAKQITGLVGNSVKEVGVCAKLVDQAGSSMDEVVANFKHVTELMQTITHASEEQTSGIAVIGYALEQLAHAAQDNLETVDEATEMVEALQTQTDELVQTVNTLQLDDLDDIPRPTITRERPLRAMRVLSIDAAAIQARAQGLQAGNDKAAMPVAKNPGIKLMVSTAHEPPLNYTDAADKNNATGADVKGFSPDVVREIIARTGHDAQVNIIPWDTSYKALETKANVVLFTMARTPARENLFQWVGPFAHSNSLLYVRRGSGIKIESLYDARKLPSVGVIANDSKEQFLKSKDFKNLEISPDWVTVFRRLLDGKISALAMTDLDLPVIAREAGMNPDDFEPAYEIFVTRLYVGFSKQTAPDVVESWQAALDSMKQDGTFASLAQKWAAHWGDQWVVRDGAVQAAK
jgi:methyl-accepting chemotaxis protein/ABC-type amino acid transport substrate-binding protein